MRPTQHFSDEYLDQCRKMTVDQIIRFLDDFRRLHGQPPKTSRLISIKVPEDLLTAFKAKAKLNGLAYQTQIKVLMKAWVLQRNAASSV
ncbi:MAG: BrnA antitoxin family protein [Gammaproteobacteria bacterium]|nr:BrnA antitoxin family protein [Gammaproteobacteria bacterium]